MPYPAGGPTDTVARILAEAMQKPLGQSVLVDNTTGASGAIGVSKVARATPDGYTLSVGHGSSHITIWAVQPGSFDLLRGMTPGAGWASRARSTAASTTARGWSGGSGGGSAEARAAAAQRLSSAAIASISWAAGSASTPAAVGGRGSARARPTITLSLRTRDRLRNRPSGIG